MACRGVTRADPVRKDERVDIESKRSGSMARDGYAVIDKAPRGDDWRGKKREGLAEPVRQSWPTYYED